MIGLLILIYVVAGAATFSLISPENETHRYADTIDVNFKRWMQYQAVLVLLYLISLADLHPWFGVAQAVIYIVMLFYNLFHASAMVGLFVAYVRKRARHSSEYQS